MRRYLSFGGGVNSTALMLWLLDQGIEVEAVYADHGADWPETYEYVGMLQSCGYAITVLKTRRESLALYDYAWKHRVTPSRVARWCTTCFKSKPLARYMKVPCMVYLGYSADEPNRVSPPRRKEEERLYPLIDEGIDRQGCIEIIKAHDLPVPIRSHCYFCPNAKSADYRALYRLHPDLFGKALALENRAIERQSEMGTGPFYIKDKPLEFIAQAGQLDAFDDSRGLQPCLCGL